MRTNWKSMIKPAQLEREEVTSSYGRFVAKPLERGFGMTLGNSLRRILLSSLQGAAVVGIRIDNVEHEFSTLPEVSEDVTEIILNLKNLNVWLEGDAVTVAHIDVVGPKTVLASDIITNGGVRMLNPNEVICTVGAGGHFKCDLYIRSGKGYMTSDEIKEMDLPVGVIPMDAVFSPVKRATFSVTETRVGQKSNFNKLVLEIVTNGGINPEDAIAYAAKILKDQLSIFINFHEIDEDIPSTETAPVDARINENLNRTVDELELSVRAANCLEIAGIRFLGELVTKTESELLRTKNFGRKTLNEIKDILTEMGLHLGMKTEGFDINKARENNP